MYSRTRDDAHPSCTVHLSPLHISRRNELHAQHAWQQHGSLVADPRRRLRCSESYMRIERDHRQLLQLPSGQAASTPLSAQTLAELAGTPHGVPWPYCRRQHSLRDFGDDGQISRAAGCATPSTKPPSSPAAAAQRRREGSTSCHHFFSARLSFLRIRVTLPGGASRAT